MLSARRLPHFVVVGTFAVSAVLAATGVTSVALGAGQGRRRHLPGHRRQEAGPRDPRLPRGIHGLHLDPDRLGQRAGAARRLRPHQRPRRGPVRQGGPHPRRPQGQGRQGGRRGPVRRHRRARPDQDRAPSPCTSSTRRACSTGDDLFLVGYPGEANTEDLKPTIADGILSRTRHTKVFDLSYLQTDASIGGGQSGGALVDTHGDVVGISEPQLRRQLRPRPVRATTPRPRWTSILAGKGSPYSPWPGGTPVVTANLPVHGLDEPAALAIPAAATGSHHRHHDPQRQAGPRRHHQPRDRGRPRDGGQPPRRGRRRSWACPSSAVAGATQQQLTQFIDKSIDAGPGAAPRRVPVQDAGRSQHVFLGFVSFGDASYDLPVTTSIAAAPVAQAVKDIKVGDSDRRHRRVGDPFDRYGSP